MGHWFLNNLNIEIMKYLKLILSLSIVVAFTFMVAVSCTATKPFGKGGAQLWGENCMRCHNTPPPTSFGDEQWDVIATHMELRAQLTDQEMKTILEFLKSAN